MKNHTRLAIVAIAIGLATPSDAAKEPRKENRPARNNSPSQQLEKNFDAITKAVADARTQTTAAIRQRDAAVTALEQQKIASAKASKQMETQLAESKLHAEKSAKELADTRQKLEKANQALAVQIRTISETQKNAKAAEAKHAETLRTLKLRETEIDNMRKEAKTAQAKPRVKKTN